MGRKPIGKVAMSASERTIRWRQRKRAEAALKDADKHQVERLREEVDQLRKRVEEVERLHTAK